MAPPTTALPSDLKQSLEAAGAPAWYMQAVSHPTTTRRVDVGAGLMMSCVFWNKTESAKPTLLFVHGYRANARAWHAVAPLLTDRFRVIAVDLMGMGESDAKPRYGGPEDYAADIAAAIRQLDRKPIVLAGHSFGGACSIRLAQAHPELVSRLIVIDTTLLFRGHNEELSAQQVGKPRPYPDRASIMARYRLLPEQPCPAWALTYMAHHSIREVDGGWVWSFDPELPTPRLTFESADALKVLKGPVDYVYGGAGRDADQSRLRLIEQAIDGRGRVIEIPGAHHHIMLDQPLALVDALQALLA